MKKYILLFVATCGCLTACNPRSDTGTSTASTTVTLPYTADYTTDFNTNISDSDLLMVLNSYKFWEQGDMKALRTTMGDSMKTYMSDGFHFAGLADSVMGIWSKYRDSLSSVKIAMHVWLKNHAVKDSTDFVNVWYKEIDTYKNGKVDSAEYEDDNAVKNGKINWFSSHKQKLKKM